MADPDYTMNTEEITTNPFSQTAAFQIMGFIACLGLMIESLSWLVCYRTSGYHKLKSEVEVLSAKAKALEASGGKDSEKKLKKIEESLKKASGMMVWYNFRVLAINAVAMFIAYRYISYTYKGLVVARLPFVPFKFVTRMSHGNLKGDDFTECSGTFIYILCQAAIRPNIQKLIGVGPSRALVKQTSLSNLGAKEA